MKQVNEGFSELVEKCNDDIEAPCERKQLVQYIVQNFYRHINSRDTDIKNLLMLVAALSTVSAADPRDSRSLNAARRLATKALSRS